MYYRFCDVEISDPLELAIIAWATPTEAMQQMIDRAFDELGEPHCPICQWRVVGRVFVEGPVFYCGCVAGRIREAEQAPAAVSPGVESPGNHSHALRAESAGVRAGFDSSPSEFASRQPFRHCSPV